MNPSSRAAVLILAFAASPTASFAQSDTRSDMRRFCTEALTEEAPDWFAAQLDEAEDALGRGEVEAAVAARAEAAIGLPRTADVSVHPKCVGQTLYARYLDVGRRVASLRAQTNPDDWQVRLQASVASGTEPAAIADLVPLSVRAFDAAASLLAAPAQSVERDSGRGYFVLAAEREMAETASAAASALRGRAAEHVAALLAREESAFTGPLSEQESGLSAAVDIAESLTTGITGVEAPAGRAETSELLLRARRSMNVLDELDDWLDAADAVAAATAFARAETRGDVLLDTARRESYAYSVREELYEAAVDYFDFAQAESKLRVSRDERERIQPALQAERQERQRTIEAAGERVREDAESVGRGVESLRKTDEERREFEEEAAALAAELGF